MSNVAVTNVATTLKYGTTMDGGFTIVPHELRDKLFQADISSGAFKLAFLILGFMKTDRIATIRQQTLLKMMNYSSNSRALISRWTKELIEAEIIVIEQESSFDLIQYDFGPWIDSLQKEEQSLQNVTVPLQSVYILKEELKKEFKEIKELNELTPVGDAQSFFESQTSEIAETLSEELELILLPDPITERPQLPASEYGAEIFAMIQTRYKQQICPDIIRLLTPIHKSRMSSYIRTGRNAVINNPVGWFDGLIKEAICHYTYLKNLPSQSRQSALEKLMQNRWNLLRAFKAKRDLICAV